VSSGPEIGAAAGSRPGRSRALVVDDEPGLVEIVTAYLEREGFEVASAADGEQAVALAQSLDPDVIVLDLMLPGIDGIEACRQIRVFSDAYIVMLTAKSEEHEKIVGLTSGADDYLTKPFSPGELVARIRAMLRRPRGTPAAEIRRFGALEIDVDARETSVDGSPVELTKLEFDLLDALSEQPRVVLSRTQLLERVWGPGWFGDDHLVDVHIGNLRQKLGDARFIRTVRGVGYRMGDGE
jgi:DNA-binding response OmpR family regulator